MIFLIVICLILIGLILTVSCSIFKEVTPTLNERYERLKKEKEEDENV